jgi:4-hydroxybenzoate polyprenyltransferase
MPGRAVALFRLGRSPMVFTSMADPAAGVVLGGGAGPLEIAAVLAISAALYSFGMVLNDVADERRDRELHPDRPLATGEISRPLALAVAAGLLAAAALVVWAVGSMALAQVTVLLIGAILLYDLLAKRLGLIGAIAMGGCRALNLMLGLAVAGAPLEGTPFVMITFLYVMLVTCVSLLEESPSRPVFLLLLLLACLVPMGVPLAGRDNPGRWMAALVPLALLVRAAPLMRRPLAPGGVGSMIGFSLRMIIVLDAAYAASMGQWVAAGLILLLLPAAWGGARLLKVVS